MRSSGWDSGAGKNQFNKIMKNEVRLLPLLFLYLLVVFFSATAAYVDDEARFVMFATNLSNGYYSPANDINLWNGPGYPIVLLPFILLGAPLLTAKFLNAVFLFVAILFFYKTLILYMQERPALVFSYLLGIYPPFFRYIHQLMSETFTVFLTCGFLFYLCKSYQLNRNSWKQIICASIFLGYLALTKIFFGYVILALILFSFFFYALRISPAMRKMLLICLIAMLWCMPYLFYTYSLTGKIFYWGNSGGLSLYYISSPNSDELGDWFWEKDMKENSKRFEKHRDIFNRVGKLSSIQKDEEFKKIAVQNIINNPLKYLKNWLANIGRLLFNYPYSYSEQKLSTYFFMIPNMFLVVFSVLCIYPTYICRKLIPLEIYLSVLFGAIYIAGSSIVSAYNRMLWPVVPVFSFWIFYILNRFLKVDTRQ